MRDLQKSMCGVGSRCLCTAPQTGEFPSSPLRTGTPLCACDVVPAPAVTRCQGTVLNKPWQFNCEEKLFPLGFLEQETLHEPAEELYSVEGNSNVGVQQDRDV